MEKKILFLKARTGMDDPSPPMAFSFLARIAKEEGFDVLIENLNAQYNNKTNKQSGPYFRCTECGKSVDEENNVEYDINDLYLMEE